MNYQPERLRATTHCLFFLCTYALDSASITFLMSVYSAVTISTSGLEDGLGFRVGARVLYCTSTTTMSNAAYGCVYN